jgi:hypothetical protein
LNDGLLQLCVDRQGAHHKYCQSQEPQKTDWQPIHDDPSF